MGTRSWAWAVTAAAADLRERLAMTTGIPPEGITVRSDTTEALGALAQKERHSYGAQFAEVAVDTATGEIRVRRMLGIFAAGRIVNPLTARNQLVGGMTWGISMALHEEAVRDRNTGGHYAPDLMPTTSPPTPTSRTSRRTGWTTTTRTTPSASRASGRSASWARRRPSPTRSTTPPAYATGTCPSGRTGSSPRRGPPGVRWMLDIAGELHRWIEEGREFAVGTVVSVGGSAPRGPGAALAVDSAGTAIGSVSGGCVEGAVYELCAQALQDGGTVRERFGYSDEDAFAVGLTCGGVLDIMVTPVRADSPQREVLRAALAAAVAGGGGPGPGGGRPGRVAGAGVARPGRRLGRGADSAAARSWTVGRRPRPRPCWTPAVPAPSPSWRTARTAPAGSPCSSSPAWSRPG